MNSSTGWLPTAGEMLQDLAYVHPGSPPETALASVFDGNQWARATGENWQVPLGACAAYALVISSLHVAMSQQQERLRLRRCVFVWNAALALFSIAGAISLVPAFLYGPTGGLLNQGFYKSVCSAPAERMDGWEGLFLALFIYSKLFELIDTVWLVLRKSPLSVLHCWHHVSVLLYCWHAYSTRTSTGLWFATINYVVHALMYSYFALTQLGKDCRRAVKPFAIIITSLQLSQMVVGIVVTLAGMHYSAKGDCEYVNRTNSVLGLAMYASYFVLFGNFFVRHYLQKEERLGRPPAEAAVGHEKRE